MKKWAFLYLAVFAFAEIILCQSAFSCIEHGTGFAAEVLLTKPELKYDLSKLFGAIDVSFKKIHFGAVEGIVYVSHYNKNVVVIIAEDVMKKPLPRIKKYEYPSEDIKGLDIIIQIPNKQEGNTRVEAVDINREAFNFKKAMEQELLWLRSKGIIVEISDLDIQDIVEKVEIRQAGIAKRIVYHQGKWLPYMDIKGAGMFLPRGSCSNTINLEVLLELINQ